MLSSCSPRCTILGRYPVLSFDFLALPGPIMAVSLRACRSYCRLRVHMGRIRSGASPSTCGSPDWQIYNLSRRRFPVRATKLQARPGAVRLLAFLPRLASPRTRHVSVASSPAASALSTQCQHPQHQLPSRLHPEEPGLGAASSLRSTQVPRSQGPQRSKPPMIEFATTIPILELQDHACGVRSRTSTDGPGLPRSFRKGNSRSARKRRC